MANSLNYVEPVPNLIRQRPFRFSKIDNDLLFEGNKNIIIGTTPKDNVEVWIYDSEGNIVANTFLRVEDESLSLYTVLDVTGAFEFLNINLEKVVERLFLPTGRYSIVLNIFRDEVGNADGDKMYIHEISPSRTELRLKPVRLTMGLKEDLYEYTSPSVPRLYAKALVDQLFQKNLDPVAGEYITPDSVVLELNKGIPKTSNRIIAGNLTNEYTTLVDTISERTYALATKNLIEDTQNINVQVPEFDSYINNALGVVLNEMVQRGEINPNFELIT